MPMKAFSRQVGCLIHAIPFNTHCHRLCRRLILPHATNASFNRQGSFTVPKPKMGRVAIWVFKNEDFIRSLPIYVGGFSLFVVLFNRIVTGVAPIADASSSQSRADLLTLALAVTNILNGLVWLSIKPKSIYVVNSCGTSCQRMLSNLPYFVVSELLWVWESLATVTCCRSLVIVYDAKCFLQIGSSSAPHSSKSTASVVDANKLMQSSLCLNVINSGSQSYLANLSLYPGKSELPFLPSNTQAVILQPIGNKGIAIIGGNTIRGFTTSDQAWIAQIGEKLDATLAKFKRNIAQTVAE